MLNILLFFSCSTYPNVLDVILSKKSFLLLIKFSKVDKNLI